MAGNERFSAFGKLKIILLLLLIHAASFWFFYLKGTGGADTAAKSALQTFTLLLLSILLEALPFVLLGILISSLIQVFVSEETILRVLPENNFLRLVLAALLGLVFPVCECAIIPIARGLIRKGMPPGPAIAFMLATPIVNPVVLLSTYNAFGRSVEMMLLRAGMGFAAAVIIGLLAGGADADAVLKSSVASSGCAHGHHCICGHAHGSHGGRKTARALAGEVLSHANRELRSVGMYLIIGALIASFMQVFVPAQTLLSVGAGPVTSILVMMLLAFVLSLCSEADAFIASTFTSHFTGASVLAFLITGPMIDLKNTMMMFGIFKAGFAVKLILSILLVCFGLSLAVSLVMGGPA